MYKIIDLEQNTPEWLDWREGKATASQSPSVMGESKYFPHTPYEMYLIATGQAEKPFYNKAMQRGHEFEDEAREFFNKMFGSNHKPLLAESEQYENFAASLDGFDSEYNSPILEIKVSKVGGDIWDRGLDIYHWQLVHQCAVMGCENAVLFVYDPDQKEGKALGFKAKKTDINKLVKAWGKYFDCINNFEIPALTERDYRNGDNDQELVSLLEKRDELKIKAAQISEQLKEVESLVIDKTEGKPTKAAGHTITKVVRKGSVNYKAIPELKEVDLEQYRKQSTTYWRIS